MRTASLLLLILGCLSGWDNVDVDGDGFSLLQGDCWDAVEGPGAGLSGADVSPAATERWYDGVDQDCGEDDDYDVDLDGYVPAGYADLATLRVDGSGALPGGDCWDLPGPIPDGFDAIGGEPQPEAAGVNPGSTERWYDGVDQDCSGPGEVDSSGDFDADGDGFNSAWYLDRAGEAGLDCIDGSVLDEDDPGLVGAAAAYPGAPETWYDGTDQDCAGDDDLDADADGFAHSDHGGTDCDDSDPERSPDGTREQCYNGVDDNCDTTDGDGDCDGDGFWAADYAERCAENGATPQDAPDASDCWDLPDQRPAAYTAVNHAQLQADEVNPGATERWYDGVDQDCAGDDAREFDVDGDGDPSSEWYDQDGEAGGDCIDGGARDWDNPAGLDPTEVHSDATETWYDGTDQDCAGDPSDDDADGDGHDWQGVGGDDCDDDDASVSPSEPERCGTGVDDDCSGDTNDPGALDCTTWYQDRDGDGYGTDASAACHCESTATLTVQEGGDCLDTGSTGGLGAADLHPEATEVCDEVDNDCDGLTDDSDDSTVLDTWYADSDSDGFGDAGTTLASCVAPSGWVADSADCDDGRADVSPAGVEVCDDCSDGSCTDEDCDGLSDDDDSDVSGGSSWYADADSDGFGEAASATVSCLQPAGTVADATDCDDSSADVRPDAPERCSTAGVDDDCDGSVDESDAVDARTWYRDSDSDSFGDPSSSAVACAAPPGHLADNTDCDDASASVHPGATELWYDGTDQACDGGDDDDADADGVASADHGGLDCEDGDPGVYPGAADAWYDGVDGDCGGDDDYDADGDGERDPSSGDTGETDCDDACYSCRDGVAGAGDTGFDGVDGDCDGWVDEGAVGAGDLVLTEIMMWPGGGGPEWFEVLNVSGHDLVLDGWQVSADAGAFCLSVDAGVAVADGALAVFCASSLGALGCDYVWQDNGLEDFSAGCAAESAVFALADAEDTLSLGVAGTLVDSVGWQSGWPVVEGRSMIAATADHLANDTGGNWCSAGSGSTDTGDAGDTGAAETGTPGDTGGCP